MATEVAAVFSLGNSEGQCLFVLERILPEEPVKPDVFIIYGQPAEGQKPNPLDAIAKLNPELAKLGLEASYRAVPAFSLDACYRATQEILQQISKAGYRKIYLGITGGSNPMVAALFHAGMTELSGEVVPVYVQGKPEGGAQQSVVMFRSSGARDAILFDRVLSLARAGEIGTASALAADLPHRGKAGFVRDGLGVLSAWDRFDYSVAPRISAMRARCEDQMSGRLSELAGTLLRYIPIAERALAMEALVRDHNEFAKAAARPGWRDRMQSQGVWLPLDALANAYRRASEGAYTDATMRAYRAVEVALQFRLFRLGVHPSALNWTSAPLVAASDAWRLRHPGELPAVVAFEHCAHLLEVLEDPERYERTLQERRQLQATRNECYLEHGYRRIDQRACTSCLEKAKNLCADYLDLDLAGEMELRLETLSMRF